MNLIEQVKDIFKNTVCCGNCGYHGEDCYCSRVEELFGVEVRTANDSTCICLDGFKMLPMEEEEERVPVRVETERIYCKDCPDFESGICMDAYYKNEENYKVSENDYCDTESKWYAE